MRLPELSADFAIGEIVMTNVPIKGCSFGVVRSPGKDRCSGLPAAYSGELANYTGPSCTRPLLRCQFYPAVCQAEKHKVGMADARYRCIMPGPSVLRMEIILTCTGN